MSIKGSMAIFILLCSGCASTEAVKSPSYPVSFTSEPSGATVSVGGQYCTTPCTLQLLEGQHEAAFFLKDQERAVTATAVRTEQPSGLAGALHGTGTVLNTYGEMGLKSLETVNAPTPAAGVLVFASGVLSIGSIAAGQAMITVGDMLAGRDTAVGNSVHVVFVENGAVEFPGGR